MLNFKGDSARENYRESDEFGPDRIQTNSFTNHGQSDMVTS